LRTLHPPAVFYTEDVINNPLSHARMDRMMERIACEEIRMIGKHDVEELSDKMRREEAGKRSGEIGRKGDPTIVFINYKWADAQKASQDLPRRDWHFKTLSGLRWVDFRDRESIRARRNIVCQSGYEFHSAYGCLHHCDYCFLGNTLMIALNLEELRDHLNALIDENPWQSLYKYDNQTDNLCFEPEYGASKLFVEYFAQKEGKYLMLYTKSDNVDHLLDLDHRGKTVVCWTLTCDKAARLYEEGAPSMDDRIGAARKCQEAGYTVRFRFSPIIPIKNWREENETMIKRLFSQVEPDIVCIQTLTHMKAEQLRRTFDLSHMDEDILTTMDEEARGDQAGPFPHEVREGIYRFFLDKIREVSPETPVVTCLETPEMWRALGDRMGMEPVNYVCCCGPTSTPENPLYQQLRNRASK